MAEEKNKRVFEKYKNADIKIQANAHSNDMLKEYQEGNAHS